MQQYAEGVTFHSPGFAAQPLPWGNRKRTNTPKVLYQRLVLDRLYNTFGVSTFCEQLPRVRRYAATLGCGM